VHSIVGQGKFVPLQLAALDSDEAIAADGFHVLVPHMGLGTVLTIYGQFGAKKNKLLVNPSVKNQHIKNEPFFEWLRDVTKDYGATKGDRRKAYVEEGKERMFSLQLVAGSDEYYEHRDFCNQATFHMPKWIRFRRIGALPVLKT
jgi:hypothetical protein